MSLERNNFCLFFNNNVVINKFKSKKQVYDCKFHVSFMKQSHLRMSLNYIQE